MNEYIIDAEDKVAIRDDLGHDVTWDGLAYGDADKDAIARFNEAYEMVGKFHTDGDTYQGTTFMRVIRRKADGKLFGFSYWEGGGKYGEPMIGPNGDDHGFPGKYDWQDGVDADEVWYVFLPVKAVTIPAYNFEETA